MKWINSLKNKLPKLLQEKIDNLYHFSPIQFSSVAQLCPTLCDPMDCSPPGSSVCGNSQARVLEWGCNFPISFSRGSIFLTRDQTCISCLVGGFSGKPKSLAKGDPEVFFVRISCLKLEKKRLWNHHNKTRIQFDFLAFIWSFGI